MMLTEIRLDWIPATLTHLDETFELHREDIPAKRKPSEYWPTNFLAAPRSSTSPRSSIVMSWASRPSCSDVTSRTPKARGAHAGVPACRLRRCP